MESICRDADTVPWNISSRVDHLRVDQQVYQEAGAERVRSSGGRNTWCVQGRNSVHVGYLVCRFTIQFNARHGSQFSHRLLRG